MNYQKRSLKWVFGSMVAVAIMAILALPGWVAADDFVIEDQASCEAAGGAWNALDMCIVDNIIISEGDSLAIDVWLRVDNKLAVEGLVTNSGAIDINGLLEIAMSGRLINHSLLFLRPSGSIDNTSVIDNLGEISNGGSINNEGGTINSRCTGVIYGSGTFAGNDPIETPGSPACSNLVFLPCFVP